MPANGRKLRKGTRRDYVKMADGVNSALESGSEIQDANVNKNSREDDDGYGGHDDGEIIMNCSCTIIVAMAMLTLFYRAMRMLNRQRKN